MTLDRWRKIAPTIRALLIERDEKVSQKRLQKEKRRNLGQLTGDGANPLKTIEPELKPLNTTYIDSFLDSDSKKSLPSKEDSERVTVGRRRKTRHPMPADWYPDEQDRAYAHRAGHGHGEVERMASACRNYHQSKGTMIADLHATWRTWVDRAAQFAYRNGQRNGGYNGRKVGIFEAWDKLSRAVEAGENSESGQGSLLGIQDRSVRRL
jgi:hypothetical protein